MGESASQIAEELDQKRLEASEKITMIENQVTDKAEEVREEVMEAVDIRSQIEERPLIALGLAFTGGIVLGGLTGGGNDGQHDGRSNYGQMPRAYNGGGSSQRSGLMDNLRQMAKSSGLEDSINSAASAMMANAGERIKMSVTNAASGPDGQRSDGLPQGNQSASSR